MADGEIRINTRLDTAKAERDLQKLKGKIDRFQAEIARNKNKRESILPGLTKAYNDMDQLVERIQYLREKMSGSSGSTKSLYKEDLADALEEQKALNKRVAEMEREYDKAGRKIQELTEKQKTAQAEYGAVEKAREMARPAEALRNAMYGAKNGLKKFIGYAVGVTGMVALFNKLKNSIKQAVTEFAKGDKETSQNIQALKNSLSALRVSWGAAFAPILNAVAPLLQKLIEWLTAGANAVARFMAVLSGKNTYKKAVANNKNLESSVAGVGEAAAEAKRELAGFDEITKLGEESGAGGGAGGGAAGETGYDIQEETIDIDTLGARLALSVKDVLFDWSDLTPEQILEKSIAGLSMLGGAIAGGMIAGVPGVIIGAVAGLALGLLADAVTFDHDGEISRDELASLIIAVLIGMTAGIAALAIGAGVGGALLALTIGISLGLVIVGITDPIKGKSQEEIKDYIAGLDEQFADAKPGSYEERYYQHFRDYAVRQLTGAGEDAAEGFVEGTNRKATEKTGFFATIFKTLIERLKAKDVLDSHSPSKVMAKLGDDVMQGFLNGITGAWSSLQSNVTGKFNQLKQNLSGIVQQIKGLFNFQFQMPQLRLPHLSVSYTPADSSFLKFFGVSSIPHVSVQWYARGGIVDSPTLFGAGEAGREAIVPLERNTEWIGMVAGGIVEKLTSGRMVEQLAQAFARVPAPSMASGNVLPPNVTGYSEELRMDLATYANDLKSSMYAVANMVVGAINAIDLDYSVDGLSLARRLYKYNKQVSTEHGTSMMNR